MKQIQIFALILIVSACSSGFKERKDPTESKPGRTLEIKPLIVDTSQEDGWGADIRMSISNILKTDSSSEYWINSTYKNSNVGFQISIPSHIPKQSENLPQVLIIKSSGIISNNFLKALADLYKERVDPASEFIPSERVAFIDLKEFAKRVTGKEGEPQTETKEYKLFFEAKNADDNAEIFMNINEKEKWIELKEKDNGYRREVIKFLTKK